MGKWMLSQHDEVLSQKMKQMIVAAIARAKLERGEPHITYEAFIEELAPGDWFASSLIDILVKELADRRTRHSIDRRLISERTAKSLRAQATGPHFYRSRDFPESYLNPTGPERIRRLVARGEGRAISDTTDDELDMLEGGAQTVEGARTNSELHEAFAARSNDLSQLVRSLEPPDSPLPPTVYLGSPEPEPEREPEPQPETVTSPRPQPTVPSFLNSLGLGTASSSSTLLRQNSLRRSVGSRFDEFNNFTLRRRAAARQASGSESQTSRPDEPSESRRRGRDHPDSPDSMRRDRIRRLLAQRRPRFPGVPSEVLGLSLPAPNEPADEQIPQERDPASSRDSPMPAASANADADAPTLDFVDLQRERQPVVAPRLRRGGLRAPESLFSSHDSPNVRVIHPAEDPEAARAWVDEVLGISRAEHIGGGEMDSMEPMLRWHPVTDHPHEVFEAEWAQSSVPWRRPSPQSSAGEEQGESRRVG